MRKVSFDRIPFSSLTVDGQYQRALINARVKSLMKAWDFDAVGVLTVSQRDRHSYIIDGQHRWQAAINLGYGDTKVSCEVHRNLATADEAQMFLDRNNSRVVTAIDKYSAGLVARDQTCLEIQSTLRDLGLRVGKGGGGDGAVICVAQLLRLAAKGTLRDTIEILHEAWGTRSSAYETSIVAGAGLLVSRYNGELDRPSFVKKLSKYKGGPSSLLGDARGLAGYKPITVTSAVAEVMLAAYNRGRRSSALQPL